MHKNKAALYLRSSKDRSDISIAAQRHELQALAADRGFIIVSEYRDVVESAKNEHRPGFQSLLYDLKSAARPWDVLLLTDTSRLSRRRYVAHVFKHEAAKRGVTILYAKVPEVDPISQVVLEAVFEAMDEVHSLMSREKGLAGMAENVRQGYRAGGRAPRGYQLRRIHTGAVREGEAVTKSVLAPNEDAPLVARYLKARAAGTPRARVVRDLALPWPPASMVELEWNALTYAGHTVWNVRAERDGGRHKGGRKRRPRSDWQIQRDTHEALIGDDEAEALLSALENSAIGAAVSRAKTATSDYLLTGLLFTPDGDAWIGNGGKHYRTKPAEGRRGRWLRKDEIDSAVTSKLLEDMKGAPFVTALVREAHKSAAKDDPAKSIREDLVGINGQVARAMDLAMQLDDPAPALRKVDELESRRRALAEEIARIEREYSAQIALRSVTEEQIKSLIDALANDLEGAEPERLKGLLRTLVERVTLDPETLACQIHYRIAVSDRLCMASPRVADGWPVVRLLAELKIA